MFNIIKPGTKYDFLGKAPLFTKISLAVFIASLLIIAIKGVNLGLDRLFVRSLGATGAQGARLELNLPAADVFVYGFERPNLFLEVYDTRSKVEVATSSAAIASARLCRRPSMRRSESSSACTPSDTRLTPAAR